MKQKFNVARYIETPNVIPEKNPNYNIYKNVKHKKLKER